MKTLPTSFIKNGFAFTQLYRDGRVAVFEKSKPGHRKPHFETVVIQEHKPRIMAGVEIPATEGLPSSEQWGAKGWTFDRLERAMAKARSLTSKEPNYAASFGGDED